MLALNTSAEKKNVWLGGILCVVTRVAYSCWFHWWIMIINFQEYRTSHEFAHCHWLCGVPIESYRRMPSVHGVALTNSCCVPYSTDSDVSAFQHYRSSYHIFYLPTGGSSAFGHARNHCFAQHRYYLSSCASIQSIPIVVFPFKCFSRSCHAAECRTKCPPLSKILFSVDAIYSFTAYICVTIFVFYPSTRFSFLL